SREAVREGVARTEDHRRLEDREAHVARLIADQLLGLALRAQVVARPAIRVRLQRAHVQEPRDARLVARTQQLCDEIDVHMLEPAAVASPLVQDADEIDDGIGASEERRERALVVHVRADQLDAREHEQIAIPLPAPRRNRDPVAGSDEMGGERTSDETRSAEHTNVPRWRLDRHESREIPCRKKNEESGKRASAGAEHDRHALAVPYDVEHQRLREVRRDRRELGEAGYGLCVDARDDVPGTQSAASGLTRGVELDDEEASR